MFETDGCKYPSRWRSKPQVFFAQDFPKGYHRSTVHRIPLPKSLHLSALHLVFEFVIGVLNHLLYLSRLLSLALSLIVAAALFLACAAFVLALLVKLRFEFCDI